MKSKLLLSTLTLGLLAGVYVWQAQAQTAVPPPTKALTYQYKVVVQPLPAQPILNQGQSPSSEAVKPQELDVLKNYPDWEITYAELLPRYPAGYTPPHGAGREWPAMVYTLRKAK